MCGVDETVTIPDLRKVAAEAGAAVVPDGFGSYAVIAPPGRRWVRDGFRCVLLPLDETPEREHQAVIRRAVAVVREGHEPAPAGAES